VRPNESFPGTVRRGPGERDLLHAVRDLVVADRAMRHAMGQRMHLGETDMRAVRFVMSRARSDDPATPREVAGHLGITTAATTTLLDRLVRAGHVERRSHPSDRRSKVVVPTPHAWEEAQRELAPGHDRMRAVAAAVPEADRAAVLAFLAALTAAMWDEISGG
jgi:DNA-binding MarR family transcriptional regulator